MLVIEQETSFWTNEMGNIFRGRISPEDSGRWKLETKVKKYIVSGSFRWSIRIFSTVESKDRKSFQEMVFRRLVRNIFFRIPRFFYNTYFYKELIFFTYVQKEIETAFVTKFLDSYLGSGLVRNAMTNYKIYN